jgi:hypothetical protein
MLAASSTEPGFDRGGFALWLGLSIVAAAGWAWLAVLIQTRFAPLALFPLLLGMGVGLTATMLLRLCPVRHRAAVLVGVAFCGVVTISGQHYLAYRSYRRAHEAARQREPRWQLVEGHSRTLAPPGFLAYLDAQAAHGRAWSLGSSRGRISPGTAVWALWGMDGLLVLAAALAVAWRAVSSISDKRDPCQK